MQDEKNREFVTEENETGELSPEKPAKKKRRIGISRKMIISIVVLSVILTAASCITGFVQYKGTISELYNDNGYVVGNIILGNIDHDEITKYADTLKEDEYYSGMEKYLGNVTKASGAAYIYMVVPNKDGTMTYLYDSTGLKIGTKDPISAYFDEVYGVYEKGGKPDNYFVRKSEKYGYLTSSILPVKDSSGRISALLFVDTHMELIVSTLSFYVLRTLIIALILLIFFCFIYWLYMKRAFIRHISVMGKDTKEFVENDVNYTGSLESIRTNDELQDLAESISRMEKDIIAYIDNIQKVTAEKERIGAELNVATKIQAGMLPSIFPAFPERKDIDIFATMTPAKEVGGDFYDHFMVDENHLGMVMADVSGKGVPAALFMVIAKTLIKNRAQMKLSYPDEILEDVNNQLCEGNDGGLFVTVWLAIIDLKTGEGYSSNAGHEHPALCHRNGEFELIEYRHSPAVGTMEGIPFRRNKFSLQPGDRVYVYTDGVTEATNADDELFGNDRLVESLNRYKDEPIKNLLIGVKADIDEFVGDAPQFDDVTMSCLEYFGPGGEK